MAVEKQQELERVTRLRGFRYGLHDFLAEVDLEALKKINDNWRPAELATTSCDATEGLMRYSAWLVHCALCLGVPHSAYGRRRTSVAQARRMVRKQSWPSED